jgi:hypothetical protein
MIDSATAGAFTRECAARDLLMLIEERERANTIFSRGDERCDQQNDGCLHDLSRRAGSPTRGARKLT